MLSRSIVCLPLLLLLAPLFISSTADHTEAQRKKEYIIIDSSGIARGDKEALLILPGFGARYEGVTDLAEYFGRKGYDVFIPDYISRDSLNKCVANLDAFMVKNKLSEYKRVHVFSFIIGSWTLNRWLTRHQENNIATIVYDRSPLQERAPYALVKDMRFVMRVLEGRIMEEFSRIPYEPVINDSTNIGIIIESRATRLIRKHKKSALEQGEPDWSLEGLKQDCDDYFYSLNDHDEMYHDFSVVGPELFHFIAHGRFTDQAMRTRPAIDPFTVKYTAP
jgi:hypothetical protein